MPNNRLIPSAAILLSIALFAAQFYSTLSPRPKPLDAPATEFSAYRAHALLETLLAENLPHPTGSVQNTLVKQRLTAELDELGISYTEQKTWACGTRSNTCREVENIIAMIPGEGSDSIITLMAHYDSVPVAPGAGDDGAGVVAILETARALQLEAPLRHSIMLLFTDAEEIGLVGAEAFFQQHPLAADVALVLNFEGSGTSGGSLVLRTTQANELLIKTLAQEASAPYGFSFASEIFKRMPNDTDFSVVQRVGIAGIDFAFAGERNHYHSPNDTTNNIDLRTIQHHGENMLPLVRSLANADLSDLGGHMVFGGGMYGVWSQWHADTSAYLLFTALLLLTISAYRFNLRPIATALSAGASALTIVTTIIGGAIGFKLANLIDGTTVSWPSMDFPYRLLLGCSTALGASIGFALCKRVAKADEAMIGAWVVWWLLAALCLWYLPDAANVLLLPLIITSVITLMATFVPANLRPWLYLLTLVAVIPNTLGLIFPLEQSQGYGLIAGVFPLIGLFAITLAPLLLNARFKIGITGTSIAGAIALLLIAVNPLYSEWRPQHVNINFYQDMDANTAVYELVSPDPIEEPLLSALPFDTQSRQLLPFTDTKQNNWAVTEPMNEPAPELLMLAENVGENTRQLTVKLRSPRKADTLRLLLPGNSGLQKFIIDDQTFNALPSRWGISRGDYLISLPGTYGKAVTLKLLFDHPNNINNVYLLDASSAMPKSARPLLEARQGVSAPLRTGDQSVFFKQFKL